MQALKGKRTDTCIQGSEQSGIPPHFGKRHQKVQLNRGGAWQAQGSTACRNPLEPMPEGLAPRSLSERLCDPGASRSIRVVAGLNREYEVI